MFFDTLIWQLPCVNSTYQKKTVGDYWVEKSKILCKTTKKKTIVFTNRSKALKITIDFISKYYTKA